MILSTFTHNSSNDQAYMHLWGWNRSQWLSSELKFPQLFYVWSAVCTFGDCMETHSPSRGEREKLLEEARNILETKCLEYL